MLNKELENYKNNSNIKEIKLVNIEIQDDKYVGLNNDPQILIDFNILSQYYYVELQVTSDDDQNLLQIFYKSENEEFCADKLVNISHKQELIETYIKLDKSSSQIRLDPISTNNIFDIKIFDIKPINEDAYKQSIIRKKVQKIDSYQLWKNVNKVNKRLISSLQQQLKVSKHQPKISVVIPVYNPPLKFLKRAIDSVKNQVYINWEICIVDDCSTNTFVKAYLKNLIKDNDKIKVSFNDINSHISITTNNAVDMSDGEFIVFLDQDDELRQDALAEVVLYINKHKNTQLLYSDDDKIDTDGNTFAPQFKPSWSPEYLLSFMYCGHLKCVEKKLYQKIGGFRKGFEGSQDYDFFLRASEKAKHIGHIPKVLYHWRVIPGSTAAGGNEKNYSFQAGIDAVSQTLARRGVVGEAYQSDWAIKTGVGIYSINFPNDGKSVGIIIPTKNGYDLLTRCVKSLKNTTYKNYKIYIIDNDSDDKKTINYLDSLDYCEILKIPSRDGVFSFSYINNEAVKFVKEELVLFLNNDTEIINPQWLSQMVGYMQFDGVGSVGAKLLFPNDTIQHAGIIHGLTHGFPITSGRNQAVWEWGYLASNMTSKNFTAVTAACMLTSKKLFIELSGFDDEDFSVAFNDCDYGYRMYNAGYRNVLAPEAILYHYEGASRGHGDKPIEESSYIRKYGKWKDPYYNPNLALDCSDYSLDSKTVILHDIPKFKVLMITHNLNLEGAPKSFYEIVKGLKRSGDIEPIVLSHTDGPLRKFYNKEGIKVEIIENFNLFNLSSVGEIDKFLDKQMKLIKSLNIDVIYGNTIELFWAMHCAKKLDIPSIWNIRESEEPFSPYSHNLKIKEYMIEALKYPYKVIFVADATKKVYEHLNTQNNFITIYNGFDRELAQQSSKKIDIKSTKQKLNIKKDEIVVLILGTVCDRKGQKDLIYAIEQLSDKYVKNMRFFIVGDRKSLIYSQEMHKLIDTLPVNKKEKITVVDETSETHKYYLCSDIFICASRVESFPKVIQEAMYYKLAIITTPVFGIVEQVKDKVSALFYNPKDINALTNHLKSLYKDKSLREKISQNAKISLDILPTLEEMSKNYEEVFKEARLSGSSR